MDILEFLLSIFIGNGYLAVFLVLLICGFGVPIPEDISLVAGGIISGLGHTDVNVMVLVGLAGVLAGDATMFIIGRVFGTKVLKWKVVARIMTPQRYSAVQDKFSRYGNRVMFVARFLPGLRSPIYLTAGMSRRVSFLQFLLLDGAAALISVPVWVYLGYFGAYNREWLLGWVRVGQTGVFIALGALLCVTLIVYWRRKRRDCQAGNSTSR